ncbi:MAG: MBL fold metallo-hydrolase [Promethearchaeota archaeon]
MTRDIITIEQGKINNYLHHVDLKEFGAKRILSSFIGEFDDFTIFLDCGSSLDIKHLLRYVKKNNIDLSKVKYLIPTHHHFDHAGGMWLLYEKVKTFNPEVKILTNRMTMDLLNDFEQHLNRAKRTFGSAIGEMSSIEEDAFKVISPIADFSNDLESFKIIDTFKKEGSEIKLSIIKTPGHTPDHVCPIFIIDNKIDFIFFGEAAGTLFNATRLLSIPTSMPIYFNFREYMESLKKLQLLNPTSAGFCHFGVVNGEENIHEFLVDNETLMKEFRKLIIEAYDENPRTKHVVNKVLPMLSKRTDLIGNEHPVLLNIVLAITYGMMMDLGYRKE